MDGIVSPPRFIGTVYGLPLWMPVVLLGLVAGVFWLADSRHKRPGHCRCGYDLTGNVSGRCPECGTSTGTQESQI